MVNPDFESVPSFYRGYVNQVKDLDLFEAFRQSGNLSCDLILSIPEKKGEHRYESGKWSIKELLCHLIDAERIFAYRALRFARNDKTPLSAFEEMTTPQKPTLMPEHCNSLPSKSKGCGKRQ